METETYAYRIHVDTILFHCMSWLRSGTALKQIKEINIFTSLFWHLEFIRLVKHYSIFEQHLDLEVSLATAIVSALDKPLLCLENKIPDVSLGMCCYSSPKKRWRYALVMCSFILFWTALPRTSHIWSMQLRSGDIAGHSKRLTLLACRYPSTILARCGLALSSWKNDEPIVAHMS